MTIAAKTNRAQRIMRRLAARSAGASALALSLAAVAGAQTPGSVQDYQLPPQSKPAPPVTGPVDSDTPSARPTSNPTPTAEPGPTAAPAPSPPAPTIVLPSASPAPRRTDAAPARRRVEEQPAAATPSATQPTLPAVDASAAPLPSDAPLAEPAASAAPAETGDAATPARTNWLAIGGGLLALLAALAAFALLRRRRAGQAAADTYDEAYAGAEPVPDPIPQPSAPATLSEPSAVPQQKPTEPAARAEMPEPAFAVAESSAGETTDGEPIGVQLEAQNLNCSLVYANLAYRLVLTNRTQADSGALRVSGDIVSAHASQSQRDQLSLDGAPALHEVASIAPGESITLSGQLRMAMAHITPIQQGAAPLFVPLARFQVTPASDAADPHATTRIFVVGQAAERPGGGLRPFRLDQMPGIVRELDQRLVEQTAIEATH